MRTCQSRKSLKRWTPLVRMRTSSGGLPARDVMSWLSISLSVIGLEVDVKESAKQILIFRYGPTRFQMVANDRLDRRGNLVSGSIWHAEIQYSAACRMLVKQVV